MRTAPSTNDVGSAPSRTTRQGEAVASTSVGGSADRGPPSTTYATWSAVKAAEASVASTSGTATVRQGPWARQRRRRVRPSGVPIVTEPSPGAESTTSSGPGQQTRQERGHLVAPPVRQRADLARVAGGVGAIRGVAHQRGQPAFTLG